MFVVMSVQRYPDFLNIPVFADIFCDLLTLLSIILCTFVPNL